MNIPASVSGRIKVIIRALETVADKNVPGAARDVSVRSMGVPCVKIRFENADSEQLGSMFSHLSPNERKITEDSLFQFNYHLIEPKAERGSFVLYLSSADFKYLSEFLHKKSAIWSFQDEGGALINANYIMSEAKRALEIDRPIWVKREKGTVTKDF